MSGVLQQKLNGGCHSDIWVSNQCTHVNCSSGWPGAVVILAEGAIALSVTHSGGVLFAS